MFRLFSHQILCPTELSHLFPACIPVNAACMISSSFSHWCEMSFSPPIQMIFRYKAFCVPATSHHYYIVTDLHGTVSSSMSDCKRARLGSRPVHWDPFCAVRPSAVPPDEKYCVLPCRTAVVFPVFFCVLQMVPGPPSVNITVVAIADNQVTGDEVHRWVGP